MSYKMPASEPMAIVGSSCRFAGGVTSPSRLWELLRDPVDLTQDVPAERFNIKAFYHADGEYHGTTNSPKAYFLAQDHRVFDARFFNISPKEAEAIDPQQRMLLEVVYEALESAGYTLQQYAGDKVAVYAGLMTSDYDTLSQRDELDTSQYYATGNARSILSNRISYFFNFRGPSMTIDTACSSSLVALHQAVLSLRAGECKMACVAGANLILTPEQFIVESNLHMLSPTGHCRMWDAGADGYARGEGVAAMFIKPLSQAIADGDRIEAVIRETGVNSDGRSRGITMPNWQAQSQLIRDTYQRAGLDIDKPEDRCQYFEAHGTGTSAGDPNEARAIEDAFFGRIKDSNTAVEDKYKLLVGSVKTVIGHTEGAAGLAGLLKMVQSMKHNTVAPNMHLDTLSPAVAPFCTHLTVPTALIPWPAVAFGQPKRGSVNSFGFGGTNAHVIVEEYVPQLHNPTAAVNGLVLRFNQALVSNSSWPTDATEPCLPLVLSAPSLKALVSVAQTCLDYLAKHPSTNITEFAWNAYKRRTAFPFRLAVSATSVSALVTKLKAELSKAGANNNNIANHHNSIGSNIGTRVAKGDNPPQILGIFTGQGAQWPTMARGLLLSCPDFASVICSLDNVLQHCPDPPEWTLQSQILADAADSQLDKAAVAQPVCTAIQLALVKILTESLGIRFRAVVGHSSGEIVAAFAAGRIDIVEAMMIAHYRGMGVNLAQGKTTKKDSQTKGGMLAAGMSWQEAKSFCSQSRFKGCLWVAASNAPGSVTLSGNRNAVEQAVELLTAQGKFARILQVDTAYHSPHMDVVAGTYVDVLRKCKITPKPENDTTVWVSSVGKSQSPSDKDLTAVYWRDNMVQPVMFAEAVAAAVDSLGPFDCAVEVGPHPALMGPVAQVLATKDVVGMPYMGVLDRKLDDREAFAGFLGKMWTLFGSSAQQIGGFVQACGSSEILHNTRVVDFPTYPWDHTQAFYRESRLSKQYHFKTDAPHELLGVRTRDDDGKHQLRWRNLLKANRLPWVQHHRFQGQALLPASAYLVMALDAAKALLGKRQASAVELCDLKFPAGIILEGNVAVEVLFTLTVEEEDAETIKASVLLTSVRADSSGTSNNTMPAMKKNFTGSLIITLGPPTPDALPFPTLVATRPDTLPADPAAFYDMMRDSTGLEYTGPFRALQSLDRRHEFAMGTVRRYDAEQDTTTLKLSPAMLDGCLQTAFVTVSAPGDGAIWTAFLPVSMERVVFNLGVGDNAESSTPGGNQDQVESGEGEDDDDGMLVVDAYLTKATPATKHTPASFTADIEIFQPSTGYLEIQVTGLTVGSFGATTPDNDWELYLTTRFDLDPDEEIVSPGPDSTDRSAMAMLAESCGRVAAFYTLDGISGWREETQASIDAFIESSPYFVTLQTIRNLGMHMPPLMSATVSMLIRDGEELVGLQRHVARVVKQIAHKYPAMHVLGVTDPRLGLTAHVVGGLGGSFASFCVGGEVEAWLEKRLVLWEGVRERVRVDRVMLGGVENEEYKETVYDLVLLTTADMVDPDDVLQSVKRMMRPGGFLMLIHESKTGEQASAASHDWPALLNQHGFGYTMKNNHQELQSLRNYALTVCQAESREKRSLLLPLGTDPDTGERVDTETKSDPLTDRLLIVGGKTMSTAILAAGVNERLSALCSQPVKIVETLDDISLDTSLISDTTTGKKTEKTAKVKASAITAAIFLQDLDEPIISTATDARLAALRALFRPQMTILWVVRNARYSNPEHAASLGFARTIIAETPGLTLQMLDLQVKGGYSLERSAETVAEMFARLLRQKAIGEEALWSNEPEVHVDGHKVWVPRVMPWVEGNERVNAPRKVITTTYNTLEHVVRVMPNPDDNAPEQFVAETCSNYPTTNPNSDPDTVTIEVIFSTVDAMDIAGGSYYLCFGRETIAGNLRATLSTVNASYVTVPRRQLDGVPDNILEEGRGLPVDQEGGVPVVEDRLLFLDCLARHMSTIALLREARKVGRCDAVLLVEPDALFRECLTAAFNSVDVPLRSCSTDPAKCAAVAAGVDMECVHPRASARVVKGLFRSENTLVIDMSNGESVMSDILKRHAPRGSRYMTHASLMNSHLNRDDREDNVQDSHQNTHQDNDEGNDVDNGNNSDVDPDDELARFWSFAGSLAVITIRGITAPRGHRTMLSVPELVKSTTRPPPFAFIDWRRDRLVHLPVRSLPFPESGPSLLSPNKTYLLVGLTRDLGQSLCTLFIKLGARYFVLCSRNPPTDTPEWQQHLHTKGITVRFARLDVTNIHEVQTLHHHLRQTQRLPPVGGVVNGAMVLEDCVFAHLSADILHRVMRPKTIGSVNLDLVFRAPDMEFFIMTSSFAAIGGHAGQANYAAANMFMNGLAATRRKRGLCATALNIGVIYGLGFLHREKDGLYEGLEREGYPPISERDLHHMFMEAIVAGRPSNGDHGEEKIYDIVTGLRRFTAGRPTLHWHRDPRFGHFTKHNNSLTDTQSTGTITPASGSGTGTEASQSLKQQIANPAHTFPSLTTLLMDAFVTQLTTQLHLNNTPGAVTPDHSLAELGADSLAAVELRNWAWRVLGLDVAVMKILGAVSVRGLCEELAGGILADRVIREE